MESKKKYFTAKKLVRIALLAAIAAILMYFDFPIPFLAPEFYKLDFSEVPVLVGGFLMGPLAAVTIELVKILLIFIIKGSYTAGVGEVANFIIGCALVLPVIAIYRRNATRRSMVMGALTGILALVITAALLNYFVLIPLYAQAFKVPIDTYVALGQQLNSRVVDLKSLIVLCVIPFNLVKGVLVTSIGGLLYMRIGKVLSRY